jgi:DNA-binding transcriptional LysR family regulator
MDLPGVSISLNELSTAQQVEAFQSGRCDVGLLRPPIFGGSDLTVETVLSEPIVVALPEDHRLASEKKVALADLADGAFISPPARLGPGLYARILDICLASGFVPKIEQEANQMQTIVSLVAGGLGIALVPKAVASLGLEGMVFRPLSAMKPIPTVEIALAWQRVEAQRRPYIQAFMEVVKEVSIHRQVT